MIDIGAATSRTFVCTTMHQLARATFALRAIYCTLCMCDVLALTPSLVRAIVN